MGIRRPLPNTCKPGVASLDREDLGTTYVLISRYPTITPRHTDAIRRISKEIDKVVRNDR